MESSRERERSTKGAAGPKGSWIGFQKVNQHGGTELDDINRHQITVFDWNVGTPRYAALLRAIFFVFRVQVFCLVADHR